jgi:ribonuclease T2
MRLVLLAYAAFCGSFSFASAEVVLNGTFQATKSCPAFQSIKKKTNPGDVSVQAGVGYRLLSKNKEQATHYRVEIPNASPAQRWVAKGCGSVNGGGVVEAPAAPEQKASSGAFYILAVSWQPAFCEAKSNKKECASQTAERYDASHFTLHGLWPQPRGNDYCGVSKADAEASGSSRWQDLPDLRPQLSDATEAALDRVMPGTQSYLERHEWTKHGSCYPARDPQKYFADSVRLVEELNGSAIQKLMAESIGKTVEASTFRAAVDQTFGAGAGDRMRMTCKQDGDRRLLVEVTIGLKGDIPAGTSMKDLIMASSPTDPGCPSFVVDPVGLQ